MSQIDTLTDSNGRQKRIIDELTKSN